MTNIDSLTDESIFDSDAEARIGAPDKKSFEFQKAYQVERALDSLGGSIAEINEFWQTYFGSVPSSSTDERASRIILASELEFVDSTAKKGFIDGTTRIRTRDKSLIINVPGTEIDVSLAAINGSNTTTITGMNHSFRIQHNPSNTDLTHFMSQPFAYETQSEHEAKEVALSDHSTSVREVQDRNRSSIMRRIGIGKEKEPEKPKQINPSIDRYDAALVLISRVHDALEAAKASLSSRIESDLVKQGKENAA